MARQVKEQSPWKDRKAVVVKALKPIYRAASIDAAADALDGFEAEWGDRYPAILDLWRRNWERFTPFVPFDAAIRKIIYTTNAIESMNYQLRKVTKTRGHFPTGDAVLKILHLAIRNIGNNRGGELGTGTLGWKQALNAFAITFPGRLDHPRSAGTTRLPTLVRDPVPHPHRASTDSLNRVCPGTRAPATISLTSPKLTRKPSPPGPLPAPPYVATNPSREGTTTDTSPF